MTKKKEQKKVLVALSGGIDSAVSAYLLLKQGYEVEGAFMKNWSSTEGLKYDECPWLQDRQDALRVAAFLKIPLHTLDFEKEYAKTVMDYFFSEYKAGRTPNPDVMCNKEIKFKLLYNWARRNGFDFLATGHYARISKYKVVGSQQNTKGKKIGRHQGIFYYTIGQRQGIRVGASGPYYVYKKDSKRNRLYVTNNSEDDRLKTKEVQIHSINWITPVETGDKRLVARKLQGR